MPYFPKYKVWDWEGFEQLKWPSRSLKVTDIGSIWQATYDFLLVFHSNYVSFCIASEILSVTCKKLRGHVTLNTVISGRVYHAYASSHHNQSECHIWNAYLQPFWRYDRAPKFKSAWVMWPRLRPFCIFPIARFFLLFHIFTMWNSKKKLVIGNIHECVYWYIGVFYIYTIIIICSFQLT